MSAEERDTLLAALSQTHPASLDKTLSSAALSLQIYIGDTCESSSLQSEVMCFSPAQRQLNNDFILQLPVFCFSLFKQATSRGNVCVCETEDKYLHGSTTFTPFDR